MMKKQLLGAIIASLGLVSPAGAVIVGSGTGAQDITQPAGIAGWNNVGTVSGASGIYLGNGWVLTAAHVGPGNITFDQSPANLGTYLYDGTSVRLTNADTSQTDMVMFHLSSSPALPTLNIPSSSPTLGTSIVPMGYGLSRDPNLTYYTVTGSGMATVFTETGDPTMANLAGYKEVAPNVKRYGTNLTRDLNGNGQALNTISTIRGNLTVFQSDFYDQGTTPTGGTSEESQIASGDSGGAVFDSNNNLIGLNDSTGPYDNQLASTAIFGDYSFYADLATYRGEIMSVAGIPEPSVAALLTICIPLFALRRCRKSA